MHPNKQNFSDGVELILKKWTALQLAVEMEWAGPFTAQKAEDLHFSLVDYFEKGKKIEPEDIEDILLDVMRDEFGAILEDQSEIQVAINVCTLFTQSIRGETTLLESLRKTSSKLENLIVACKGEVQEADDFDASDADLSGASESEYEG